MTIQDVNTPPSLRKPANVIGGTGGSNEDGITNEMRAEMRAYRSERVKNILLGDLVQETKNKPANSGGAGDSDILKHLLDDRAKSNDVLITTLTTLLNGLVKNTPAAANDPAVIRMQEEVKQIREALSGGHEDPFDTYKKVSGAINEMRGSMGLGTSAPIAPDNTAIMLQIKQMELQENNRVREHNLELEERRRRWQIEDQKWQADFTLRRLEFADSKERRGGIMSALGGIIGAVTEGIDTRMGEQITERTRFVESDMRPTSFKCPDCGLVTEIKDPTSNTAICSHCGAMFEIQPMKEPLDESREEHKSDAEVSASQSGEPEEE